MFNLTKLKYEFEYFELIYRGLNFCYALKFGVFYIINSFDQVSHKQKISVNFVIYYYLVMY